MASLDGEGFSYSELEVLTSVPIHDVLNSQSWSERRFIETTIDCRDIKKSILILKIFIKIATYDDKACQEQINFIFTKFVNQTFFSQICALLNELNDISTDVRNDYMTILECVLQVLQEICSKTPSLSLDALGLCSCLSSVVTTLILSSNDDTVIEHLSNIKSDTEEIQKNISDRIVNSHTEKSKRNKTKDNRKPPNNFRDLSIVPTRDDIFCKPFLRANLTHGSFDNLDHYLDVQFRLLREDCIAQLRNGISEYITRKASDAYEEIKKLQDVKIYQNVSVESKNTTMDCRFYDIKLDKSHVSRIKWNKSKRLLNGSLLCLSQDGFETLYFAVIEKADHEKMKNEGILRIKVDKESGSPELFVGMTMTMVESTAYFEAYRHVLSSLQNIYDDDLPFRRYLVDGLTIVHPPLYVQDNTQLEYDLGPLLTTDVIYQDDKDKGAGIDRSRMCQIVSDNWPSAQELHLDDSQYKALQFALTKEFVLIQGPPGTGKTHVGLMIAKTLLHNKHLWMNERKINEYNLQDKICEKEEKINEPSSAMLIVCYTNHALDQFIEGVVNLLDPKNVKQWESKLVRVGSRCSNENINKFSLKHKRVQWDQLKTDARDVWVQLRKSHERIYKIRWMLKKSFENIFGEEILMPWVPEVKTMLENRTRFNMLKWLKIDENSLCQSAYGDYEKLEIKKSKGKSKFNVDVNNDKIEIDTEVDLINRERYIEDDDFDMSFEFREIGASFDSMVNAILKHGDFDEQFEQILNKHAKNAQSKILRKEIMTQRNVENCIRRPWKLPVHERWKMYRYFLHRLREKAKVLLLEEELNYANIRKEYEREKQTLDREILAHSEVIAMTSSGAARYQNVLKDIGPKVIIVEEAAEVLEAHVISTLNSFCEHLILIGDHKQLEPKPAVFELAKKYHLDVSMFERMINLGLPYICLERQHRMRPEISKLVRPVYEKLFDNENVLEYEDVMGIEKNVYFVSHTKEEQAKEDIQSYANEFEALYVERLTHYLLKQGYSTRQITILTPYSAQMILIRNQMPKRDYEGIRISILDNYQGEENDIILLSLVRSNKEGKIGFLDKDNRVCVALSRAKIGLYLIGNFDFIQKHSRKCQLWKKVKRLMMTDESVGSGLPLICRNHSNVRTQAIEPKDFDKVPEGGCFQKCDFRLRCGHVCDLFCHPLDPRHLKIICKKLCLNSCENGHICCKRCHFPNDCNCTEQVEKTLSCGHITTLPCKTNSGKIKCQALVTKKLPCDHDRRIRCFQDPSQVICSVLVQRHLKCDHFQMLHCFVDVKDHICQKEVMKKLPCKHQKMLPCYVDIEKYKCDEEVLKILPCKHQKKLPCNLNINFYNCDERVLKTLPCQHDAEMPCYQDPLGYKCTYLVKKTLNCKHECLLKCSLDIEQFDCQEIVTKKLVCKHEAQIPCSLKICRYICKEDVTEKRSVTVGSHRISGFSNSDKICNHLYTRKCFQSAIRFQIANPCKELVEKILKCGHTIAVECHLQDEEYQCKTLVKTKFDCNHENVSVNCNQKNQTQCLSVCGKMCQSGHECIKECHHPEPCVCTFQVQKEKECGHLLDVKCCEDVSIVSCENPVLKQLNCGHSKGLLCRQGVDYVKCEFEVEKELKCGHFQSLPCFKDPDKEKCLKKIDKILPDCGHCATTECSRSPSDVKCEKVVKMIRPDCGHELDIFCCLKEIGMQDIFKLPPCHISVTTLLPCGHATEVLCCDKNRISIFCTEPCNFLLVCGHKCAGSCSECSSAFQHKECEEICSKVRVCGHKCKDSTCGKCSPCFLVCRLKCSHSDCTHLCSEMCSPCTKPCDWTCVHYKCSNQCFQACNRPKCNELCTKRLKCGHNCLGLCGDPCPNLCRKCNVWEFRKTSNAKPIPKVELQECGHVFDFNTLDKYMESVENLNVLKRCPNCSKLILWHPRYSVELKNQRMRLNGIKTAIQSLSKNLNVFTFPVLVSNTVDSFSYVRTFGTFLAANKQSLVQSNAYLYSFANTFLHSLKTLMGKRQAHNQTFQSIFEKLNILRGLWKLFIAFRYSVFSEKSTLKSLTRRKESSGEETSEDSDTDTQLFHELRDRYVCSEEYWHTLFAIQETLLNAEQNRLDEDFSKKFHDVTPFLTSTGKAWIERVDTYPRLVGIVDIHLKSWKSCTIGHTYASVSKRERCLECYGVDKISLQSFQIYTKETAQQMTEDYEEQGARPKQSRTNKPKTGIYPGNEAPITSNLHRREDNSEEPTNLPTQTTSVDNRKKLTPEYKQIGSKTLIREDSPRSKKKNKKNRNVQKQEVSIELGFKISIKESTQQSRQGLSTRHGFNRESSPGSNHGRERIIPRPVDINDDFPALEQRNCSNPVSKMLIENEPVHKDSKIHLSFGIGKWNSSKKKCKHR